MGIWAKLRVWGGNKPTEGTMLRLSRGRPGGTATFPRTGMVVERGTGDEPDGNSMSTAETQLERGQEETGGDGDGEEEEQVDGRRVVLGRPPVSWV